jgi:membrane protease YdiL (CAAX protease family)
MASPRKSPSLGPVDTALTYAVLLELSLGLAAIVLGAFLGINPRQHLPAWWDFMGILKSFGIGLTVGSVLALGMEFVSRLPIRSIQKLDRVVQSQLHMLLGPMSIAELILLSLSAGIGEELLFRGLIQGWSMSLSETQTFLEALPGILLSAVCFGVAHPLSKAYIAIATMAGILFAVLYWATRDLLACVLAHAIYDAIICVYWKWTQAQPERKNRTDV